MSDDKDKYEDEGEELEPSEVDEPETMTGSAIPGGSLPSISFPASRVVYSPPSTTTTTTPYPSWTTISDEDPYEPAVKNYVDLPPRTTKKILIALINSDVPEGVEEEIVWAKYLKLLDVTICINNDEGRMTLDLDLENLYGTEK